MAGDHRIMEIEHTQSGAAGQFDNRPLGYQLQLLLRCVDSVLADRNVPLANPFRGRLAPRERIPGLSKC
ncbi:hypothetical protein OG892_12480 [Streptomyces sp. NBC_00341]|uniref:hypothetical protein n=1 Tax=Streptomyces sp. NBC_00341 TaxID=2975717 RepID=UPI00308F2ECF|nr:hypothetical protein OG892_12480 [Streptomyces sp. NBC_00341]